MFFRICLVAAFSVAPTLANAGALLRWTHFADIPGVNNSGVAVVDLDGDGYVEGIVASHISLTAGRLSVIGERSGALALEQVVLLDGEMIGTLLAGDTPQGARLFLQVQMQDYSVALLEFGGRPLRELRRVPLEQSMTLLSVADVDADGVAELLALHGNFSGFPGALVILDLPSLAAEWMDTIPADSARVAQLDSDPALEVVLGGTPGRVIDGVTRANEWSYPPGFIGSPVAGEFDIASQGQEFATVALAQAGAMVTLFRAAPYSPLRELEAESYGMPRVTAADLELDGLADLVMTSAFAQPDIRVLTPADGVARIIATPGFDVAALATGDMSGTAHPELLIGAYSNSFVHDDTRDAARVIDPASGQIRFVLPKATASPAFVTVGDLDADGTDDVLYPLVGGTTPGRIDLACSLDIHSGRVERCLDVPGAWNSGISAPPALGRFNDIPGDDIALLNWQRLSIHDGASFAQLWEREIGVDTYVVAMDTALFNDDEVSDIVIVTRYAQILVFDGRDGTPLWQSVTLASGWPSQEPALIVADVDDDNAVEIIVSAEPSIYAFDSHTRLLDWSYTGDETLSNLTQWGNGAACRLALYAGETGQLRTLRCDDRTPVGPDRTLPAKARALRRLDDDGERWVVAAAGRLHTVDADDAVVTWTDHLGDALGAGDRLEVIPGPGEAFDVIAGTEARVVRVRIDADYIFGDAFD